MTLNLAQEAPIKGAIPAGAKMGAKPSGRPYHDDADEPDAFSLLDRIGGAARFERDQTIFHEGDPADYYYKLLGGTVRLVSLLSDGRRQIVEFITPTQFFGFSAHDEYALMAEAVSDVVLVRYPRKHVDNLLIAEPHLARFVFSLASDELRTAQKQLVLLGRRTAKERLAAFLIDFAKRTKADRWNTGFFHLPMNRRDIADYLGLTIETVSRLFTELKRARYIELKDSHAIALSRPDALMLLAE